MNARALNILEYNKIMQRVANYAHGTLSKQRLLELSPAQSYEQATQLMKETQQADIILFQYACRPSLSIDDVREIIVRAQKQAILSAGDLLKIAIVLEVADNAKTKLTKLPKEELGIILGMASNITPLRTLYEEINFAIISDTEINSNASNTLYKIRSQINSTNERIRKKLQSYISSDTYSKYLMESLVTMRNERFVIPVKSEHRSSVAGIIHDQSASGATVYIEPMEIVDMNNQLRTLFLDEKKEIERILMDFTMSVKTNSHAINLNFEIITDLDVIFARADFSREIFGIMPLINEKGYINIIKGRHPLIDTSKVVPIDISIGDKYNILVITGPNTGGKTVTLKLTGLFVLLGLSGIFLPTAKQSEIPFLREVYCDIGDEQSIEQSLSTFSSHISNIINIIDDADSNCLVLLDELGAGTDPDEGQELAVAITEYLRQKKVKTIVTSHFSKMKQYSFQEQEVENASMDFNPETFAPTFKLIIGIPGTSNAIEIASKLGLNPAIVQMAKSKLKTSDVKFEQILQNAERLAREHAEKVIILDRKIEEKEKEVAELQRKRQAYEDERKKVREKAQQEVKRMVDDVLAQSNEYIEKIKELSENPTVANAKQAKQLHKKIEALKTMDSDIEIELPETVDESIKLGDWVYVISLESNGQVKGVTKSGEFVVQVNNLSVRVRPKDCKKLKQAPQESRKNDTNKGYVKPLKTEITLEIKLLGKSREEAYFLLDEFLEEAVNSNQKEVKIIHGIGTGILARGIWDYLSQHLNVKDYRYGTVHEGGRGVTIVTLY